ncbi:MAG: beta strand repeat-containing protein [Bdellovibrionia bacterium]
MRGTSVAAKITLLMAALLPICARSTTIPFGFFATKSNKLIYTTTAQSIYAGNCSGITTVKSVNASGATKNVASNLTVNLATVSGVTYYSDSSCSTTITSVTIASGTSSASFYFISASTGTQAITVTATGYLAGKQNETIATNPFVWTGGGGNALWSTAANWSGGSAPGASNVALFDGTCSSNCSPTISANISIGGIRIASGYSGTITQNSGVTITTSGAGYYQASGTFTGGNSSITIGGPYALVGGTFTSTSANLRITGAALKVANSPTFNHVNGKVELATISGMVLSGLSGISFYDVDLLGNASSAIMTLNSTLNVLGSLRFIDYGYSSTLAGTATINVSGNLETQGSGWKANATVLTKMIGTGTITGPSTGTASFGALEIATSGTVTFASTGTISFLGDFTYTSGTVVTTGSTVKFIGGAQSISPGAMSFNHVNLSCTGSGYTTRTLNGTLKVLGDLTLYCNSYSLISNSGTIEVSGNLNIQSAQVRGGTTLIKMVGTGTITGSGSGSYTGPLEIATSGTITFANTGSVDIGGNFTYTSGTVVATGSTVQFIGSTGLAINPGNIHFNHVAIVQDSTTPNTLTGTLYVGGNLTLTATSYWPSVNGGTIDVKGNLAASGNFTGGTTSIVLSGSGVQTLSMSGSAKLPGTWLQVFNSSSVLTLGSNVDLGTSPGIDVFNGSVNMAGYNLTTKTLNLELNVLTKNGGVLTVNGTVAGTGTLYGGTVNP